MDVQYIVHTRLKFAKINMFNFFYPIRRTIRATPLQSGSGTFTGSIQFMSAEGMKADDYLLLRMGETNHQKLNLDIRGIKKPRRFAMKIKRFFLGPQFFANTQLNTNYFYLVDLQITNGNKNVSWKMYYLEQSNCLIKYGAVLLPLRELTRKLTLYTLIKNST